MRTSVLLSVTSIVMGTLCASANTISLGSVTPPIGSGGSFLSLDRSQTVVVYSTADTQAYLINPTDFSGEEYPNCLPIYSCAGETGIFILVGPNSIFRDFSQSYYFLLDVYGHQSTSNDVSVFGQPYFELGAGPNVITFGTTGYYSVDDPNATFEVSAFSPLLTSYAGGFIPTEGTISLAPEPSTWLLSASAVVLFTIKGKSSTRFLRSKSAAKK